MSMRIHAASGDPTIQFALQELARYIDRISGRFDTASSCEIRVGLISEFFPERVANASAFDDEILIDVHEGSGIVAGVNPRSCLLAAYRLLREVGCRFLRPGTKGEYVPKRDWRTVSVRVDEKPSYRHRGICIEGAVSRELYLDIIDWLPKNGMNSYFIQFHSAHTFFERWYAHRHNPAMKPEQKTAEEIRAIVEEGIEAIKRRGMIYHEMGHGWTCEPLGIPGNGWDVITDVPTSAAESFAMVNGRRELWGGIPLNTNLCYGNPEVRALITDHIVTYAQQNPNVDILHFWLADGMNNHCECPLCAGTRPADFYVEMLNRLDERLSELGISTKIVFLIYFDLLWLPEKQQIHNPDRFILMFAPITRTYSRAFSPEKELPELPAYVRNRLSFPSSVEGNLAFLKAWQGYFPGDSFDFDYHLLWDQYKESGYEELSHVLHEDLRNLQTIGLNGFMSCQVQRSFFPSPLPMDVLGQTLWNRDTDYDALADDLYATAFGKDGVLVKGILKQISALFHPQWLRLEEPVVNAEQEMRLKEVPKALRELRSVIAAQNTEMEPCQAESWRHLALYCTYADKLAGFCLLLCRGSFAEARIALDELLRWAFSEEESLGYAFDCDTMRYTLENLYKDMTKRIE